MFLNRKKKRYLTVTLDNSILFEGLWDNLPISEDIIIMKSIEFFNDKEPCVIHRSAVQIRLLAELEQLLSSPDFKKLFCTYTGFHEECQLTFSEK